MNYQDVAHENHAILSMKVMNALVGFILCNLLGRNVEMEWSYAEDIGPVTLSFSSSNALHVYMYITVHISTTFYSTHVSSLIHLAVRRRNQNIKL